MSRPATHLSPDERAARGKLARAEVPRGSHAAWEPPAARPDPIDLLERQAATRVPELVPIRYGRMLVSPFAFLRGSAAIMASDLSSTPRSGFQVQLCGDAHLSNFGIFGTPERRLAFDLKSNIQVWYAHFDVDELFDERRAELDRGTVKRTKAGLARARTRDHLHALAKLAEVVDGEPRIVSDPPLIAPID